MKKEFICLKLDQYINQQLILWAAKSNMPLGEVIRALVENQIRRANEKRNTEDEERQDKENARVE